jgi:hypothetical protein
MLHFMSSGSGWRCPFQERSIERGEESLAVAAFACGVASVDHSRIA